jgi:pyruvate dehydrogenase kinase 2/3/4
MILFGQNPSQGTLLKASQFLAEELPIRLSHRVKELDELPDRLNEMESIKRVKEWYAESFQVRFCKRQRSWREYEAES